MADGIAVGEPGLVSFAHVATLVDDVVTVSEECLSRARAALPGAAPSWWWSRPGAAAVAALLQHPGVFEPPVVAVLSGGNIDPVLLLQVIQHGMAAGGRYLPCGCGSRTGPGSLVGVLSCVERTGRERARRRALAHLRQPGPR